MTVCFPHLNIQVWYSYCLLTILDSTLVKRPFPSECIRLIKLERLEQKVNQEIKSCKNNKQDTYHKKERKIERERKREKDYKESKNSILHFKKKLYFS